MKRKTTKRFITEAKDVHGDRYDYSLVEYTNNKGKVNIICRKHGAFLQEAKSHLYGSGCMKCHHEDTSKRLQHDASKFIKLAKERHDDRYNYSLVEYIRHDIKVKIICEEHGIFEMMPSVHSSSGQGCPKCGQMISGRRLTTEQFIQRANKKHNNRFDYSLVKYINTTTPVIIICPDHGEFTQLPSYHLDNQISCHDCVNAMKSKNGLGGYTLEFFNQNPLLKDMPATLYVVNIYDENESFIKVGITIKPIKARFSKLNSINYKMDIIHSTTFPLYKAYIMEQSILVAFSGDSYCPNKKFDGWTECFPNNIKQEIINSVGFSSVKAAHYP